MNTTTSSPPGKIGTTIADSQPWWPTRSSSQDRRTNVLIVVLDDMGWSDLGCFGSEISTPCLDGLAETGVRFNQFHVTPLCSPTRASMLSGRNHHAIGMRFLADTDTGFPNSRGSIRQDVPLLPQILRAEGYGSYLVGKWHLAPLHEVTPAGPYTNWPLARGFDRYYGFLDGCTDQYAPELFEDNHAVTLPASDNYHLSEDLANKAISYIRDHVTYRSEAPFFLQLAFGATHAPFQAPREYIDKYIPVFTKGWDQTRVDRLKRQIAMGLVPTGTELTDRPDGVPAWDSLTGDEQTVFTALQAAFSGFLEHADAQIGRVLDALAELGVLDDTIVLALSDNGASREGGPFGDVDTNAPYSGVRRQAEEQLPLLSELGTATSGAHYPEGWAMAGNTPFRFYKQFVDLGGVRSPLLLSWTGAPQAAQGIRDQFVHVVDLAPTLLELLRVDASSDMDGESVALNLTNSEARAGRNAQYWETLGHRAIWSDGWKAVTSHTPGASYDTDTWRLYNTLEDFSEAHDLAAEHPVKLQELQQKWWREAGRNDVFPLDDRPLRDLIAERGPIGLFAEERITLWPGQSHVPFASAITGSNRNVDVLAEFATGSGPADGVIVSSGNVQGGYLLYVVDSRLVFEHSHLREQVCITADLAPDARIAGFQLRTCHDGSARVSLTVDGVTRADGVIPRVSGHLSFWGLDVAHIVGTTFSTAITPPFAMDYSRLRNVTMTVHAAADDLIEYAETVLASE
ncbi:arylsulfatase [Microbacterium sp. ZW CA_36]|uniref:arylsulfatase n=1 Tax=Microbacterium sp. ZW CA_36 TaxID=3378078 RepID=UPI003851EBE0